MPRHFGAPLAHFWDALQAGALSAEGLAAEMHASVRDVRDYTEYKRQQHNEVVHRLHFLKRKCVLPVPHPPPAYKPTVDGASSDQLIYSKQSGGLVRRSKTGGVGAQLGRPFLGDSLAMGAVGTASRCPSALMPMTGCVAGFPAASQGQLDQPARQTQCTGAVGTLPYGTPNHLGAQHAQALAAAVAAQSQPRASLTCTPSTADSYQVSGSVHDGSGAGHAGEESCPTSLRVFELVRDAISSMPQELAPADYVRQQVLVQAQAGMAAALPHGTMLMQYVSSALVFMATPANCHAARTQYSSGSMAPPPAALIHFDELSQSFRWIGPTELSTSPALRKLEAKHYEVFLAQHGGAIGTGAPRGLHAAPVAQKNTLTLPPGSHTQLATFRREEAARYAHPDLPFTYTCRDGSCSAAAPLGKKSEHGKAREHFLLVTERPPSVTLLSLVRDAAARLPGGEGSRTDVCELLKESAYITDGANDAQVSTVVSGALDRLHYEGDPCVRFDAERKLWIYLHGSRTEASFAPHPTAGR